MKRQPRCSRLLLFVCAATLLLMGISTELAAQGNLPPLLSVRVAQVKSDKVTEWEGLQKELSAALKKAGQTRSIWQVARGELNTYHIVSGMEKFAEFDEPASAPMEAAACARWQMRASECVGDRQLFIVRTNPDRSIPLNEGRKRNLMVLTMRQHAPGRGTEYATVLEKEVFPAYRKAGINGYSTSRVFAGASPRTWVTAVYLDKWADFDGPSPLQRAFGENAAKLASKLGSMTVSAERVILRFREDLSASGSD